MSIKPTAQNRHKAEPENLYPRVNLVRRVVARCLGYIEKAMSALVFGIIRCRQWLNPDVWD